jgi:putative tricarboxylic transport membrane protein
MKIRNSSDLLTAIIFLAIGFAALLYGGYHYALGTPARMGPGFYPTLISLALILLGVILLLQALFDPDEEVGSIDIRPVLLVLAGTLLFGFLIERAGLLISSAVLVFAARLADRDFSLVESALIAVVLMAITTGLFWYALGLPLHLLPA